MPVDNWGPEQDWWQQPAVTAVPPASRGYGMLKPATTPGASFTLAHGMMERLNELAGEVLECRERIAALEAQLAAEAQKALDAAVVAADRLRQAEEQSAELAAAHQRTAQAEAAQEALEQQQTCVVCMVAPRTHIYRCGHFIVCQACCERTNKKCPICGIRFRGQYACLKVFVS